MAVGDDSTAMPFGSAQCRKGEPFSEGLALLDLLALVREVTDSDDPRYHDAFIIERITRARLYALVPVCVGDVVAKLMTVMLCGERMAPADVGMVVWCIDHLTAAQPHLRRPELVRDAVEQARDAFPGR